MKISQIADAIFIGRIGKSEKSYSGTKPVFYQNKLKIDYCRDLPKGFVDKHLSIVYFICVNDTIYKIGQTSGKNGIRGCLNFYCSAGQDDPGPNRFTINALIRECLNKNDSVDVYIKYLEPIEVAISGISKIHNVMVPISAKCLEEVHLEEYKKMTGSNPLWNFQESGRAVPSYINENFATYRKMRAQGRK